MKKKKKNKKKLKQLNQQILKLEVSNFHLTEDVERLNDMLRRTGYDQGKIDAYVDLCDDYERLKEEAKQLRLGWCRESEKRQKEWNDGNE